jgi:hypothetical protein
MRDMFTSAVKDFVALLRLEVDSNSDDAFFLWLELVGLCLTCIKLL